MVHQLLILAGAGMLASWPIPHNSLHLARAGVSIATVAAVAAAVASASEVVVAVWSSSLDLLLLMHLVCIQVFE